MSIGLTLIGQIIAFAMFTLFCMKYVWPPITAVMGERRRQIDAGLKQAKEATDQLEQAELQVSDMHAKAKQEAEELIGAARARSQAMVDEAVDKAKQEAGRALEQGKQALEQERIRTEEQLRQELAGLVVSGVKLAVADGLSKAQSEEVVERMLKEMGKR